MQAMHTSDSRTPTVPVSVPRELNSMRLSTYERAYLDWYHGDPQKRSCKQAHAHCTANRAAVQASTMCGCFCCGAVFPPAHITHWLADRNGDTACCPQCRIDAVLGDASGYPLTVEFLAAMRRMWFG